VVRDAPIRAEEARRAIVGAMFRKVVKIMSLHLQ